jgi:hypothetical protein
MTTVSADPLRGNRRRVHASVGTAAAALVAVATVSVGAQFIGVTPPLSDISAFCAGASQCLPDANRLLPRGLDPLVPYGPAVGNSGNLSGPIASPHTYGPV